jgi:fumarate hydratase class II
MPLPVVHAMGIVKAAAAKVNLECHGLDPKLGNAIIQAAEEVRPSQIVSAPVLRTLSSEHDTHTHR